MVTSLLILLAFFNGFLIVTNRVVNAKLGLHVTGAGASFWNHFVGFLFLTIIVSFLIEGGDSDIGAIPFYLFLGGIIGACYVAISSLVIPKVGATKATILVIAGQIVLGTIIDIANGKISNINTTIIGISLVVLGIWIGNNKKMGVSS
jgi:bacterial/archaeal transporter family-2 protein